MNWERTELAPPGLEGKNVVRWQEGLGPSAGTANSQEEMGRASRKRGHEKRPREY